MQTCSAICLYVAGHCHSAGKLSALQPCAAEKPCRSVLICSHELMERERLSVILQSAPAWARLGLTVPDPRLRERAADALAATIVERLDDAVYVVDRDQLALQL